MVPWSITVHCAEEVHRLAVSESGALLAHDHAGPAGPETACGRAVAVLDAVFRSHAEPTAAVAAAVYRLREARLAHPTGDWDDGRRWWPDEIEYRPCCERVRAPSRAWPWSLMVHCRTARHVAALFGVEERSLRAAARAVPPLPR